jgi:hypothetical protein
MEVRGTLTGFEKICISGTCVRPHIRLAHFDDCKLSIRRGLKSQFSSKRLWEGPFDSKGKSSEALQLLFDRLSSGTKGILAANA